MEQVKEQIIEQLTEQSAQQLENIIQNSSNQLKISAANFMKVYFEFEAEIKKIELLSVKMQELRESAGNASENLPNEYYNYLQQRKNIMSEEKWNNWYAAVVEFQKKLNSFLGQQMKTVFVAVSGRKGTKQVEIYELPIQNFLKPGISKNNKFIGKLDASLKKLREETNGAKKISFENDEYFSDLSETYLEALERYDQMKSKELQGFYYQIKNQFEIVDVKNKGDIGEAFLNGALGKKKIPLGKNIEINLKNFGGFVIQVDNASGLLFGDFSGKGKIEYSAKSTGASFMGFPQVISLAQDILSGNIVNKKDLKNKQKEYLDRGSTRNQIQTVIDESVQEILKTLKLQRRN